MSKRKNAARLASVGAAATVAIGLFSTGAANADTFVPLPGGELVKTLSDGTEVTVRLAGESANINPSMGATPAHRNAWVSASAQVELNGAGAEGGGSIYPGYVVGCQVNIDGGGAKSDVEGSGKASGGEVTPGASASTTGELTLGPGQSESFYVLDIEKPDDYGNEKHSKANGFDGDSGSVTWADETIDLSGCGGYAQARSFVNVSVQTENVSSYVTLWGEPFSLG